MLLDLVEPITTNAPQGIMPSASEGMEIAADGDGSDPDFLQIETLALNLDASLNVHSRPHFFNWTQGLLQSLIKHEVLVCALRNGQPLLSRADSFSTATPSAAAFGDMLLRDTALAANVVKAWEALRYRPVVSSTQGEGPFSGSVFARELERLKATRLIAHGCHDATGQITSLFVFACRPELVLPDQGRFVELLVPHLHAAWMRSQLNRAVEAVGKGSADEKSPITAREQQVLRWIYLGKSNFEIGAILSISPLTVKNHVQKILRKLDVVNRTQAVGKAIDLRILVC